MGIRQFRIQNGLRRARKIAGLSQRDVAKRLGMSSTDRISRWEKGTATPNIKNLFRLCILYKVSPTELYDDYFEELIKELGPNFTDYAPDATYINPDNEFS